jgi:hypothetical protein
MGLCRPFAAIFEPLEEVSMDEVLHGMTTKSGRTQGFFDCAAGENAFLAGCEVRFVGTQAFEITKSTARDGKR